MSAKRICIFQQKGGIGKTALTCNVGSVLAQRGHKVLLIDGDTQKSLTRFFLGNDSTFYDDFTFNPEILTIRDAITGNKNGEAVTLNDTIITKPYNVTRLEQGKYRNYNFEIDLVAGGDTMEELEFDDALLMRNLLDTVEDDYDFILIDCPPAYSDLVLEYMCASDYVLVPSEMGRNDSLVGYFEVAKRVGQIVKSEINENLRILGLVYTKAMDYKKNQKEQYDDSLALEDLNLFKTYIRFDYKPSCTAEEEHAPLNVCQPRCNSNKDYENLTDEICTRLNVNKIKREMYVSADTKLKDKKRGKLSSLFLK